MADEGTTTSRFVTLIVAGSVVLGTVLGSIGGTAIALSSATTADPSTLSDSAPSDPAAASGTPVGEPTALAESPASGPVSDPALGHPLPTSCADLYSPGMLSTMSSAGVALNPAWIYEPGQYDEVGTLVSSLQPILETANKLTCTWTLASGGSEVGLTTEIVQVTQAQASQIDAKLTSIGWTRLDELGGVRFVVQQNLEGNAVGESQFIREGLWFATQYVNLGVNGYTADMVTQVFG